MDKPEKLIVELVVNNPVATGRLRGYNDAIDDYDKWLEESASEEKIESILKDWGVSIVESYKMGVDEYREWRKSLAESISKSIIGK